MQVPELSEGVYVFTAELGDPKGDSNFGLIVGTDSVILIDADIRRWDETVRLVNNITELPVKYLINTHDNFDHTSANNLLRKNGALIISSDECRKIRFPVMG